LHILSSLGHAGPFIAIMDVPAQLSETAQTEVDWYYTANPFAKHLPEFLPHAERVRTDVTSHMAGKGCGYVGMSLATLPAWALCPANMSRIDLVRWTRYLLSLGLGNKRLLHYKIPASGSFIDRARALHAMMAAEGYTICACSDLPL
jgi:hypothetical protein